ncbi:Zn(2)-C6 fungal-type domain-containing protein [Favolaschia claudopus]|uniref:Zn(2)-C6 fungal-type domain-containing protein n=1 Tax=Favolaschia claudopus TaxID=2862362 RepID=A0AAW0B2W0_9AGAR
MSWPSQPPNATYTIPFSEYDDPEEHDDDDVDPDTPGGAKKTVRRRSSKACDQCRKSKCKCERPGPGEPCRSCVVLGTECTSLGPSRKRGPPKGYIDAIEARLHQTEALVGILLAAGGVSYAGSSSASSAYPRVEGGYTRKGEYAKYTIDEEDEDREDGQSRRGPRAENEQEVDLRAQGLLADIAEDPLARAILARIDVSAYGPAGRVPPASTSNNANLKLNNDDRGSASPASSGTGKVKAGPASSVPGSGHPSHEWMDQVTAHVLRRARQRQSEPSQPNRSSRKGEDTNMETHFHSPLQPIPHPHPLTPHPSRAKNPSPHTLAHSQSHPHLRGASEFEHTSPVVRPRSGTPNGMYASAYPQPHAPLPLPQQPLRTHHSASQLRTRHSASQLRTQHNAPQRPAIITALPDEYRPQPGFHPLSANSMYSPAGSMTLVGGRALPLSADGSDGRRLRRRVDDGPEYDYGPGDSSRRGGYRDAARTAHRDYRGGYRDDAAYESPIRLGRERSYSVGSGSEAELDVDVPHSPSPRITSTSYVRARESHHDLREDGGEGLAGAVGQLSLNEDKQVRYHGKVSGLHLLARRPEPVDGERGGRGRSQHRGTSVAGRETVSTNTAGTGEVVKIKEEEEEVGRNVGGIWRFPKARVWPVAPEAAADDDYVGMGPGEVDADGLPPRAMQEVLLDRYFMHVHPSFPVVHKRAVQEAWARGEGPPSLLLLAMFALAARHASQPPSAPAMSSSDSPAPSQYMWPAGDAFLFRAKILLDSSYASSRASTCQALLLMGFREIGIGAMAQAWIYIGMAVRMAQDLGMQRDADGWVRAGVRVGGKYTYAGGSVGESALKATRSESLLRGRDGVVDSEMGGQVDEHDEGGRQEDGKLFGRWEIGERRRIWYACVIMDKYVSTYIGRPLAIFERDFDTSLPSESDAEELEEWGPAPDAPIRSLPRPGHVISCFNASARLAGILSHIVQSIYALRPAASRHAEQVVLDEELEKWRLSLPAHLQHDPARTLRSGGDTPHPQVLTLHMQYWTAVLLLHRPFIRQTVTRNKHSPAPEDQDVRGVAEKSYDLCAAAANHITTIATLFSETYTLKHCPVFLCYYIFTASIMHVTALSTHPKDPQARLGLTKVMDALKELEMIWPAAGRALELLRGARVTLADTEDMGSITSGDGNRARKPLPPQRQYPQMYSANGHYGIDSRGNQPAYFPPGPPYDLLRPTDGTLPFQGALSTAVMGPAYSTGLVDEHQPPVTGPHARFGHHAAAALPQQQQPQQYWNEYAPFPPLASGYGELHDPAALAVHGEPQIYPLHDFGMYPPNQ